MIRPKTFFVILISTIFGIHFVLTFTINMPKNFGKTHFVVGMPIEYCEDSMGNNVSYCPVPVHEDGTIKHALFSPDDDIQKVLVEFIDGEQESIHVAVYMFTNDEIAQALIRAHDRGIHVEVITDKSAMGDRYSKIDELIKKGITVFVFNPKNSSSFSGHLMHNKFVLFGKNSFNKSFILTGSFNYTKAAQETNQENLLVLDEQVICQQYSKHYDTLKQRCTSYSMQPESKRVIAKKSTTETTAMRREQNATRKKTYLAQLMDTKQIHAMV